MEWHIQPSGKETPVMPSCPHCGQDVRFETPPPPPWWKPDLATHGVSLGCGSLALIAIIVALCSGGTGFSGKLESLNANIERLEKKIDDVSQAVDRLTKKP
jgi:hypothetical protein